MTANAAFWSVGCAKFSLKDGEFYQEAIAIGQFTPGPVLSTARFIGYVIAGIPGAIVATIGIFLLCFVFVVALNLLILRLQVSSWTRAFLN